MATPASQDVEQGAILWLPKHDEVMAKLAANGLDDAMAVMDITRWYETEDGEVFNIPKPADPKTYDHPIAVVSRPAGLSPQSPDLHRIHFVVLTSFGGRALTKYTHDANVWKDYLAIAPQRYHPLQAYPGYKPLTLQNEATMNRGVYAENFRVYSMDWRAAGVFVPTVTPRSEVLRLDTRSLMRLLVEIEHAVEYEPCEQFSG
ncbi:hypothetical protein LTR09_008288 [Extremus antarcticus]|uniref:Uncharacterized protein n=1 Tax=Extremus antarcticus TaxID=702011 RepID=A0AAJ0DHP2_9PEZI|nr:hypothetical protein LTR09_008288 [Extremus antarcticus]